MDSLTGVRGLTERQASTVDQEPSNFPTQSCSFSCCCFVHTVAKMVLCSLRLLVKVEGPKLCDRVR